MEVKRAGYTPNVWLSGISQLIVDAQAGRGGLEAMLRFFDNIDCALQGELSAERQALRDGTIFFEGAIGKCNKEQLKRPLPARLEEAQDALGLKCEKCGFESSLLLQRLNRKGRRCIACNGKMRSPYTQLYMQMVREGMKPTPEAVLMYVAYDRMANAFVAAYKAAKKVADKTVENFGWEHYQTPPDLEYYLDMYHIERYKGEQKIPREEKQMLQFISRAIRAGITVEEAEPLIRLGLKIVRYGYLYQSLSVSGAKFLYEKASAAYIPLYNELNAIILERLGSAQLKRRHEPSVTMEAPTGLFTPWFLVPKQSWESGVISENLDLKRLADIPIYSTATMGSLQTIYAPLGGGKTLLLGNIACHSVLSKNEVAFTPLGDETNSFSLACMPLFGYSRGTQKLLNILTKIVGVEPHGLPTLNLNFLLAGEKIHEVEKHPPTIYDRIVEVEDPKNFSLDFEAVINEIVGVAKQHGFRRPAGIITVRNLERYEGRANINIDVEIAATLLDIFNRWRKTNLRLPCRVFIDEVAMLARSRTVRYAGDAMRSGQTIEDFIKEIRRNRISLDIATQMPLEILPNIRRSATNVLFRDLSMSYDKSKSEIDFLLESLQLTEPEVRSAVREVNNRGTLGVGYWFWHHRPTRSIEVIRPSPPIFCHFDADAKMTSRQIFKAYEKQSGEKILLDSWDEVKRLSTVKVAKKREHNFIGI